MYLSCFFHAPLILRMSIFKLVSSLNTIHCVTPLSFPDTSSYLVAYEGYYSTGNCCAEQHVLNFMYLAYGRFDHTFLVHIIKHMLFLTTTSQTPHLFTYPSLHIHYFNNAISINHYYSRSYLKNLTNHITITHYCHILWGASAHSDIVLLFYQNLNLGVVSTFPEMFEMFKLSHKL